MKKIYSSFFIFSILFFLVFAKSNFGEVSNSFIPNKYLLHIYINRTSTPPYKSSITGDNLKLTWKRSSTSPFCAKVETLSIEVKEPGSDIFYYRYISIGPHGKGLCNFEQSTTFSKLLLSNFFTSASIHLKPETSPSSL